MEACSGALMSHNTYGNIVKNKGNIDYWYDLCPVAPHTALCDNHSEEPAKHCMLVKVAIGLTTALCIGGCCRAIVHTALRNAHGGGTGDSGLQISGRPDVDSMQ